MGSNNMAVWPFPCSLKACRKRGRQWGLGVRVEGEAEEFGPDYDMMRRGGECVCVCVCVCVWGGVTFLCFTNHILSDGDGIGH